MQVDKVNQQTIDFKSKFVPNKNLEQTFNRAISEKDRFFLQSVKAILNDGKNDKFELKQKNSNLLSLFVNDEITDGGHSLLSYYSNAGSELIKKYASKYIEYSKGYNNLSDKEKKLISEDVDLIKLLSENFENFHNYFGEVQNILKKMKQKIDSNTKNELEEIQKTIFQK